jgi:hypothetical protein
MATQRLFTKNMRPHNGTKIFHRKMYTKRNKTSARKCVDSHDFSAISDDGFFFQLIADKLPETIFDFLFKLDFDGQAWPAVWPTERDVDQCVYSYEYLGV